LTTYTANSAYCYSNSLHMCVTHAGMASVPGVDLLECMTGMPFGAAFLKRGTPMFFPSPAGRTPDQGLTRALETLGWTCDVLRLEDAGTAEGALRAALPRGPALIGPLDMGACPMIRPAPTSVGRITSLSPSIWPGICCRCTTRSRTRSRCCPSQT
jgi:hypothetical protein